MSKGITAVKEDKNVLGEELETCCISPMTGFFRDGSCRTGPNDLGVHVICAEVTKEFLEFSKSKGNDLTMPSSEMDFPGLKPGDRWCLCVMRWKEAYDAGVAPPVILSSTHISALEYVSLDILKKHAIDLS